MVGGRSSSVRIERFANSTIRQNDEMKNTVPPKCMALGRQVDRMSSVRDSDIREPPRTDENEDAVSLPTSGRTERWLAVLVIGAVLALALAFAWAYATRKNAWPDLTPPAHNEP